MRLRSLFLLEVLMKKKEKQEKKKRKGENPLDFIVAFIIINSGSVDTLCTHILLHHQQQCHYPSFLATNN